MGYLAPGPEPVAYDCCYYAQYERLADTPMGHELTRLRRALVDRWAGPGTLVVDVGVGALQFVRSRPNTWGYDVNPVAIDVIQREHRWLDPHAEPVPALTFWDALEHIPDPAPLLAQARDWMFASLPVVPGDGPPPRDWKHLKPGEHLWYWTRAGFLAWMAEHGFRCVGHNTAESLAGREDIETFAFRRVR